LSILNLGACASFLVLALCLSVTSGCKPKSGGPPSAADLQAFSGASPELKQMWELALTADKTNGYATAETLFYALLRAGVTPDQKEAVVRRLTSVTERLDAGLEKGDANAKAALEELRRNPPNRQM
jgi:hypothetical protein